ncbi:MBL fold metallo-hydrolase [Arthrobacter sp. H20]|uniref:MBL fold metallo-hydrolase n=1 Tax=Arthrobacter sp. H20 TaxID=1267981 RepID=UPI0004AF1AC6|nr:MBL fold metallo-hydrolase [Arthrobacter sp. H20]
MRLIAKNCYQLEHSKGSNGYLVNADGSTALIDPGMPGGYTRLLEELRDAEPVIGPVTDILLTHYDADHTRVVKQLQQTLGVPIWLGAADAAILRGDVPPPTRFRRFLARVFPTDYPAQVRELAGEQTIVQGLTTFPTPGHTPGHMAFQFGGVLFSGDAVTVSRTGELSQFYRLTISDPTQAKQTEDLLRRRITGGMVQWICAGHNAPAKTANFLGVARWPPSSLRPRIE